MFYAARGAAGGVVTAGAAGTKQRNSIKGDLRAAHSAIVKSRPPDQTPKVFAVGAPSRAFERQRPFTV